ncbi:Ig-like domain-containing protein [Rufibacter sediminis]|uniref:Ig-like domain-containing protein n=1 Tax=Rufibacter sediminis TaxID=2762756 RepID=A0ABR6VQL7_9BACT|nr:Ig-like domain-containing protein [Rufibacter sediminis]MBC3539495.1 Ig-like domain-containing protein [Rufibacter sediminis]
MKKQLIYAVTVIAFFLKGCASISSPEGGAKDVIAPKLVVSYPRDGQTNVKPEKIVLTFDENIQALDLTRQLIIAPFSENTYKSKVKDRTVELTFSEPWEENTTYSLNFRNSLADVTEKNPARNVVITFSTGPLLDSGRVTGQVNQLFSTTPPKEVNVLLYSITDTSQVTKGRPLYVTGADSSGNFAFKNIKEGEYFIYGLTETNNNLRYDNEKENIAYTTDTISVRPAREGVQLTLHTQDVTRPNVVARRSFLNLYEVEYNEGITTAAVTAPDKDSNIKWLVANNGKTLRLFPGKPDEKQWLVQVQDSAGNSKLDTVAVRLSGKVAPRKNNSFTVVNGSSIQPGEQIRVQFEVPTKIINPAGAFTFVVDSATTIAIKDTSEFRFNQDATQLQFRLPLVGKRDIVVSMDTTKVLPFIGDPYGSNQQTLQISDKVEVGSLKVLLKTNQKNFIVQLMRQNAIEKEVVNQKTILWDKLAPGSYQIRILVDANGNGKWDNGLLKERRLPEPVVLPKDVWEIRANWEIETQVIEF